MALTRRIMPDQPLSAAITWLSIHSIISSIIKSISSPVRVFPFLTLTNPHTSFQNIFKQFLLWAVRPTSCALCFSHWPKNLSCFILSLQYLGLLHPTTGNSHRFIAKPKYWVTFPIRLIKGLQKIHKSGAGQDLELLKFLQMALSLTPMRHGGIVFLDLAQNWAFFKGLVIRKITSYYYIIRISIFQ